MEILDRIAPKAGYDNDAKANYRNKIWASFADAVQDIKNNPAMNLKAVLMPSFEGLEIETALNAGLREEDIIAVDRSAAVIATSKWRKLWPNVNFFASEIADVGAKIKAKGWIVRCANLDLCGNFSANTVDAVKGFYSRTPHSDPFTLAVTVAKGREGSALVMMLKNAKAVGQFIEPRLSALMHLSGLDAPIGIRRAIRSEGAYISGRQPMAWAVQDFERHINHVERVAKNPLKFIRNYIRDHGIENMLNDHNFFTKFIELEHAAGFYYRICKVTCSHEDRAYANKIDDIVTNGDLQNLRRFSAAWQFAKDNPVFDKKAMHLAVHTINQKITFHGNTREVIESNLIDHLPKYVFDAAFEYAKKMGFVYSKPCKNFSNLIMWHSDIGKYNPIWKEFLE